MSDPCTLCGRPMVGGQQQEHFTCREAASRGERIVRLGSLSAPTTGRPWQTETYRTYLTSPEWKAFRQRALESAHYRCQRHGCGKGVRLQVHHKTYERLGNEQLTDVVVMCETCHHAEHVALRERARFRGWASRVYGDDWDYDDESAWDAFDAWIGRDQ